MEQYGKTNTDEYNAVNPVKSAEHIESNGVINFNDPKHCNNQYLIRQQAEELWELKGKQNVEKTWETSDHGMEYIPLHLRLAMTMSQSM